MLEVIWCDNISQPVSVTYVYFYVIEWPLDMEEKVCLGYTNNSELVIIIYRLS